jgi:histidyl-tRNA synthetase
MPASGLRCLLKWKRTDMPDPILRLKGTYDILPAESGQWQWLEDIVRLQMQLFNYGEMRTPVFERTEVFSRGIGDETDIVKKEMYTFADLSGKSLTLKPEMTAAIMRAYLQNNLQAIAPLQKVYYIAPMFRQENPQAGRQRQFHQFGAEAIGSPAAALDAEVIILAMRIISALGLKKTELKINTIGDPTSRQKYNAALLEYFTPHKDELCRACRQRLERNPLRILDCKNPACQRIVANAPHLADFISPSARSHFNSVCSFLDNAKVSYRLAPLLVRGLDYYTDTVFEIISSGLGAQNAVCGGGRYNLLARELGGKDIAAVGFAAGMERLLLALHASEIEIPERKAVDVFVVCGDASARTEVQSLLLELRQAGIAADTDYLERSLKAQMREANRQAATWVIIVGADELERQVVALKNMQNSEQREYSRKGFIDSFLALRNA